MLDEHFAKVDIIGSQIVPSGTCPAEYRLFKISASTNDKFVWVSNHVE